MSFSLATDFNICWNPHKLWLSISDPEKCGDEYAISICLRDPEGNTYKALIMSLPFTESRQEAVDLIQAILEASMNAFGLKGGGRLPELSTMFYDVGKDLGREAGGVDILTQQEIYKIVELLGVDDSVDTSENSLFVLA